MFAQSKDPFFDGAPINMWSLIEVNLAIICSSVPGKRSLLYSLMQIYKLIYLIAMKPLLTKTIKVRSPLSDSTNPFDSHQMMPLNDEDKGKILNLGARTNDLECSRTTSSKYESGPSDKYLVSKKEGVERVGDVTIEGQSIFRSQCQNRIDGFLLK